MTIRKALNDLRQLKFGILKDGSIGWDETTRLLAFIEPYVTSNRKIFVDFQTTILACRKDGKISALESARLEAEIDKLLQALKAELVILWVLVAAMAAGSLFAIAMYVLRT